MKLHSDRLYEHELIDWFKDEDGNLLALRVSGDFQPESTLFLTPDTFLQQLGFIFREEGGEIEAHLHRPRPREFVGTAEFLLLKKGRVSVDLYSDREAFVINFTMEENDILLLISGGHGFTFLEKGFFVEVKQGPYIGDQEKVRLEK